MKKVLIKETQKFTGYWAVTNRAAIKLYNSYDQSAFKDYLTTTGLEGKEIIEYSIENKNIYQSSYTKPFIVNSIVSSDSLINKQVVYTTDEKSKIYKFKLGSLIGVQSELYNEQS